MKLLAVYKGGRKLPFHNAGCRDSFREDRRHGLIYGPWRIEGKIVGHEEAAKQLNFCAYCGPEK